MYVDIQEVKLFLTLLSYGVKQICNISFSSSTLFLFCKPVRPDKTWPPVFKEQTNFIRFKKIHELRILLTVSTGWWGRVPNMLTMFFWASLFIWSFHSTEKCFRALTMMGYCIENSAFCPNPSSSSSTITISNAKWNNIFFCILTAHLCLNGFTSVSQPSSGSSHKPTYLGPCSEKTSTVSGTHV